MISASLPRRALTLFAASALIGVLLPTQGVWAEDPPSVPAQLQQVQASPAPSAAHPLTKALEIITEDQLFLDASVGLHVVDARSGDEVFSYKGEEVLTPASTMKVITTATALRTLGPAYTWDTIFLTDGELGPDGVLDGNLYVQGTGDPSFVIEDLWKMVYDLELEGVRQIKGNIYLDDDFMPIALAPPGWDKKEDLEQGPSYCPSLGALSLNFNTVALVAAGGPAVGGPARVDLETPATGVVSVENKLVTGRPGSRRNVRVEREVRGARMTLTISGTIPQDAIAQRYYRAVPDPTAYFSATLASLMRKEGIKVRGKYLDGTAPDKRIRRLVRHRSPSLAHVLATTNKRSNNLMAEQVLRTVGAEMKGTGTTEAGLEVVREYLDELGVSRDDYALANGSGLSRQTLIRPELLTRVLVDMKENRRVGSEFRSSLAIGGVDGTLWARFRDEDTVGRLRGKTGTLSGVHCLAGYVEAADGSEYAFAFIVNDMPYSMARARQVHDRFAEQVFAYGAPPVAADVD